MARRTRVLLAKLGLDAHTIGITVVAHALRDAGMEVIYSGLRQTPEAVANAAIQEDIDVVGISSLSAAHMHHLPKIIEILRERGADEMLVICGGVIPEEDVRTLQDAGVARGFTMGTQTQAIVDYIEERMAARESDSA